MRRNIHSLLTSLLIFAGSTNIFSQATVKVTSKKDSAKKDTTITPKSPASFLGAVFSSFPGVTDDNPKGMVQDYFRFSIPLHSTHRDSGKTKISLFHNLFIQLTTSLIGTDNLTLSTLDSTISGTRNKFVNNLDLYHFASTIGKINLNLLDYQRWNGFTVYLDADFGIIRTNLTDSMPKQTRTNFTVNSAIYGLNLKFMSYQAQSKFNAEITGQLFWVNPATNSVTPGLNVEHSKLGDMQGSSKPFFFLNAQSEPFAGLDILFKYNTTSDPTNKSNIYLHFSAYDNFFSNRNLSYQNNFVQIQIGYALDISKLFPSQSPANNTPASSPKK